MQKKRKKILWLSLFILILLSVYPFVKFIEIYNRTASTFLCDKILIVIQSDDWGMCGVRDQATYEYLINKGFALDEDPWGVYSLETQEDLMKLFDVLSKHQDSGGNPPIITCNFILTNPDFDAIKASGFQLYSYITIAEGLPSMWPPRNLFPLYKRGIENGFIYPGYHGREHFNSEAWLKLLQENDRAARALFDQEMMFGYAALWEKIYGEYFISPDTFLSYAKQETVIKDGMRIFRDLFGFSPLTTGAPGYLWNEDTEKIWHENGIKVIQAGNRQHLGVSAEGKGIRGKERTMGEKNVLNMIYLTRNIDFEPWLFPRDLESYITDMHHLIKTGEPIVISSHSINYISRLKNYRDITLPILDKLLYTIENRYSDVYYISDVQLAQAIETGFFKTRNNNLIQVKRKNGFFHVLKASFRTVIYKIKQRI